jgi:hypothetical protein
MRTNRFLAVLLAATMVFGSTVTAFAADPTESATGTSDNIEGQGSAEGYVNTSVTKVVLPTTTATTFAFIMDPQEMLKTTNGARLGTAWTQPENDTYVYFKTAKGYANESDTVYFINKSTVTDLDVTVKAVATDASSNPIGLDTKDNAAHGAALASNVAPKLYLGLKVGGVTTPLTNEAAGVTTKVAAVKSPNEYTIVYKNKAYTYAEKAGSTFQAVPISVEGSVSHKETDVQAPKLTLTWSWSPKGTGQTDGANSVNYVTTDAYTISGATLDQTASGYGSFNGKIGPGKGGKLTMTGTTATITVPADYVIDSVTFTKQGGNAATDTNVTFKNKVVTIKGALWNDNTACPSGSIVTVTFADPDGSGAQTAPAAFVFEKP